MRQVAFLSICLFLSIWVAVSSQAQPFSCGNSENAEHLFSDVESRPISDWDNLSSWRAELAKGKDWKRDRVVAVNMGAFGFDVLNAKFLAHKTWCTGGKMRIVPFPGETLMVRHERSYVWGDAPGFLIWKGVIEEYPAGRARVRFVISENERRILSGEIDLPGKRYSVGGVPGSRSFALVFEAFDILEH